MATAPRAASLTCEKCSGQMATDRIRRFSPGLVVIGYTLWIPALLLLLGASACGVLVVGSTTSTAGQQVTEAERTALERLRSIEGLPPAVVGEFERTKRVDQSTLDTLDAAQRGQVEAAVSSYDATLVGSGIGSGMAMGGSMLAVGAAYVLGIPFFIIGLVLTLKKNVWHCGQCGYVFDRA